MSDLKSSFSSSSGLLSLAPELIQAIGDELDLAALQSCRLTCKHLSETLAPQVLGSITLDINQDTIAKEIPKLKAMAGEKIEGFSVNIRNHLLATRELTIRGVSPTFDPSYRCTWSYHNGVSVPNGPGQFVPSEAWIADEEVEKYLGNIRNIANRIPRVVQP